MEGPDIPKNTDGPQQKRKGKLQVEDMGFDYW